MDPGFRSEAFEQVRSITLRQLNQAATVPMNVLQLNLPGLLHNSDARWSVPTPASVMAAQAEELKGLMAPSLAHNSIEVTVAGNVTVEQAIEQVAATFGAFPTRAVAPARGAEGVRFPTAASAPVIVPHHGAAEQGVAAVAWPTTDVFADIRMPAVRQLLADIMTARLFDSVRASFGASYSTQAVGQASTTFRGYGYLLALADVPPPKSSVFYDSVAKIAQDLKTTPVSADELDRARNPSIAKLEQARQTNGYWISAFAEVQSEPRFLDLTRQSLDHLKAVTPADVQQAANTYLLDDRQWKALVKNID
jgi:zinc protease